MEPLKILIFNTAHRWIGEAATTDMLCRVLQERGHEVLCLIPRDHRFGERLEGATYPIETVAWRMPNKQGQSVAAQYFDVLKKVNAFAPDIIQVGRGKEHWCVAILRLVFLRRFRIVRTRHVVLPMKNSFWNRMLFRFGTDGLTAISKAAMDGLNSLGNHLNDKKRRVVFGAVDTRAFGPEKRSDAIRSEYSVADDQIFVGCIGRWQFIKGQGVFMDAINIARESIPNIVPIIAGRHVTLKRQSPQRLHEEKKMEGIMNYQEEVEDIGALIASLDIGVISSRGSEGFSRIAVEYFASGVPVVSTDVGALPEIIEHERTGLIVPRENPKAMAEAIIRLANDKALRESLTQEANKVVEKRFGMKRLGAEMEEVYKACLDK